MARIRIHATSLNRLKAKLKKLTGRSIGIRMATRVDKLNQTIQGRINYYKLADMSIHCKRTDEWLRRRLRMCYWKQWKRIRARNENPVRLGIPVSKA